MSHSPLKLHSKLDAGVLFLLSLPYGHLLLLFFKMPIIKYTLVQVSASAHPLQSVKVAHLVVWPRLTGLYGRGVTPYTEPGLVCSLSGSIGRALM